MKSLPDEHVDEVVALTFKNLGETKFGPILSGVPLDATQRGIHFQALPPHQIASLIADEVRTCGAKRFAKLELPDTHPSKLFIDPTSHFCMRVVSFYSVELSKVVTRADWAFIQ